MSEIKRISPMLDQFAVGDSITEHHGVSCYPAMDEATGSKHIVKVISIPASRTQLDALLLSGAYPDEASALVYFKELADGVVNEIAVLDRLSQQEGFLTYEQHQLVPMENDIGFHIYLLGTYKRTLARQLQKQPMTQLGAINLGLDMCAALTVCRRYGYLYADLKPENIYVMEGGSYRIGDLGFLNLDSLKYTSLPDKYRSAYTAPELADAFCELNTTIDVYAIGMILYQIYNNGELPVRDPEAPTAPLASPANADYEMSEIILKACAVDPAERWEDPAKMGQALVSYMQRNGANDTPIIPPVVPTAEAEEPVEEVPEDEPTTPAEEQAAVDEVAIESSEADAAPDAEEDDTEGEKPLTFPPDEELAELSMLLADDEDETVPANNSDPIDYEDVSEEISEILTQADEIANHPVPEPVVAPDPIDVQLPEPEVQEETSSEEPIDNQATIAVCVEDPEKKECDNSDDESEAEESVGSTEEDDSASDDDAEETPAPAKKKSHWLRNTILVLLLLGLLVGGFFFITEYYLQPVESLTLTGNEDNLTVQIDSEIDDALLTVVCKDQHGNQHTAPVVNGVAEFSELIADTGYTITVQISGFHKLTGEYSKAYSTPVETKIAQFIAVAGYEDGSVILSFTVDGRDASEWNILYSADGEEEKSVATQNKAATITGLAIDKEYTFKLQPNVQLFVTGEKEITFTATKLIYAQDLSITGCIDGKMTVDWTAPKNSSVESWSVHCTDGDQYTETISVKDTAAEFSNIDATKSYTITVTASGMSVNKQVTKPENAVSLTDMKLEQHPTYAELTWKCNEDLDEDWIISFSVDGLTSSITETTDEGYFMVPYIIPGSTYRINIKGTEGTEPLGGTYLFEVPEASAYTCNYNDKTVTAEDITFSLCAPPSWNYWDRFDLSDEDYTTEFKIGQKAGILLQLDKEYGSSRDEIFRVFAVYDKDDNLVACGYTTGRWNNMWNNGNCALDIPYMPETAGEYTLKLFFDGQFVTEQNFTIVE